MNNLSIIVIDCSLLDIDERDKMFYKVFNTEQDVIDYLNKHKYTTKRIEDEEILTYNFNELIRELNADVLPLNDEWVIPVFIKDANTALPDALMKNLSSDNTNALKTQENAVKTNYADGIEQFYLNACDEMFNLIREHNNSVRVGNDIYSVNDNDELLKNGKIVYETNYGMCEIFDIIKSAIDKESNSQHIADMILDMDVDRITTLMKHIGMFDGYEQIREFNEIGSMIIEANAWGFDVKVELENGRDYYLYGKIENDKYVIYGLVNERKEFEELLDIDIVAEMISNNKDYMEFLQEQHDEWGNAGKNNFVSII